MATEDSTSMTSLLCLNVYPVQPSVAGDMFNRLALVEPFYNNNQYARQLPTTYSSYSRQHVTGYMFLFTTSNFIFLYLEKSIHRVQAHSVMFQILAINTVTWE
jgi:hypothetical protein